MSITLLFALFLPLLGFLTLMALSDRTSRKWVGWIACGTIFISFLSFAALTTIYTNRGMVPESVFLYNWLSIKGIVIDFALKIDSLSLLMGLIITGVGFLIHVYSIGYMDHEEDFARYFACLNFFIFAMLLLVLAGDLTLLFIGWEGVGLASYLLIGFWYYRPSAAKAATKAFVVNRIGDLGLLLGILLTLTHFGTTEIDALSSAAAKALSVGLPLFTVLTLLVFWGATGKSAQLPLYTWLPDAMEGPTPVSALIHAATMVTAGVYLVVRLHVVFSIAPLTLQVVGVVGAATALFAALCALAQSDLKRVLAYSTISQLGFMFLACSVQAYYAAMFHLTMHAFIKALLFLSAGNVVHMMHGTTLLEKMGGLSKIFTRTHWLFLIGVVALAGIPPFAAFFSKELILELEHLKGSEILYYMGLFASILTGVYMMRAYCLAFTGKLRSSPEELKSVEEAPGVMLLPISILALLSIVGGFLGFAFSSEPPLETFLMEIGINPLEKSLSTGLHLSPEVLMTIGGSILGMFLTAAAYTLFYQRLGKPLQILQKSFYVENIYAMAIVRPLSTLAGWIAGFFEPKVFEASIDAAGEAAQGVSALFQRVQNGQIRSYIAWMAMGAACLIFYFIFEG